MRFLNEPIKLFINPKSPEEIAFLLYERVLSSQTTVPFRKKVLTGNLSSPKIILVVDKGSTYVES